MSNSGSGQNEFQQIQAQVERAKDGLNQISYALEITLRESFLSHKAERIATDLIASFEEWNQEFSPPVNEQEMHSVELPSRDPSQLGGWIREKFSEVKNSIHTIETLIAYDGGNYFDDIASLNRLPGFRHRCQKVELASLTTITSRKNLEGANFYVLTDGCQGDRSALVERIQQLVMAGVDLIQLRDKSMNDRELVRTGRIISSITRQWGGRFILNDRADLAVATGADGVHLGQDDLTVQDARKIVGAARLIGISTHSVAQARSAVLDGANYIGVGPVFASSTKSFDEHVGLELVRAVSQEIALPAFAIGGIDESNLEQVKAAGLSRVAVSAAICKSERSDRAARRFKKLLAQ